MNDEKKVIVNPVELLELRDQLIEKYGAKIMRGSAKDMSQKEKEACNDYMLLTNNLHHLAPSTIITDKLTQLYAPIARLLHKGKIVVFHDL